MIRRPRPAVLGLVLSVALAACGGDGDGPVPATACHYGAYCNAYEGPDLAVAATNRTCEADGGTPMAACPIEGVLGLCTRLRGGTTVRNFAYDAAMVAAFRDACEALGDTWSEP